VPVPSTASFLSEGFVAMFKTLSRRREKASTCD
jgi:hypothetical protein